MVIHAVLIRIGFRIRSALDIRLTVCQAVVKISIDNNKIFSSFFDCVLLNDDSRCEIFLTTIKLKIVCVCVSQMNIPNGKLPFYSIIRLIILYNIYK